MKKLLLILPFFILFSCTLQKRKYQDGYYVNWHSKNSKKENSLAKAKKVPPVEKEAMQEKVVIDPAPETKEKDGLAYSLINFNPLKLKQAMRFYSAPPEDTCDVLVFKDGSEIKGKVKEVGTTEVKYKRCDTPDGPTYISRKSELFMIKYANGTREVIKSESQPQQTQATTPTFNNYKQQRYARQNHPLAMVSLVMGILALVILYIAFYALALGLVYTGAIFILPFLAALAAVVAGKTAFNRIKEQPDVYKGKGIALPGFIMGLAVLGIYALVFFILLLILGGL